MCFIYDHYLRIKLTGSQSFLVENDSLQSQLEEALSQLRAAQSECDSFKMVVHLKDEELKQLTQQKEEEIKNLIQVHALSSN